MAEKINIVVHIEGGKTHIPLSEWKNMHLGDVLLLDSCSLDVGEDKGRVMLTIDGVPFFRAKVKQGNIKILEHPLYHEVETTMSKNPEEEPEEEFEEGEDLEFEEEEEQEEEGEVEDIDFEEMEEETDAGIEEEEEFAEFAEEEEEKPSQTKPSAVAPTAPPPATPPKEAPAAPLTTTLEKKPTGIASIEEIAMPVVVEVGRIQLTVKQLLEMQPGNTLELNVHPESGVDLVVNGTCIAKGELLRIGEILGIRILELV
jgi:flagellar motor switch protein FliN/FliY